MHTTASNQKANSMTASASFPATIPLAVQPAQGYAGDIPPELAWQWLQSGEAALVAAFRAPWPWPGSSGRPWP
jgi:hypothetical protein